MRPTLQAQRVALISLGALCVVLGAVGAVLPGLPTTPFLLLAAACFARGSRRAHTWLLKSRVLGPVIETWERERAISLRTKVSSVTLVILVLGASIAWGVHSWQLRALLIGLGLLGLAVLCWLPTARKPTRD